MRKIIAIVLFGLFCWPLFFKTFVLVNWLANKNYIETVLCVKKEDSNNTCKGSCHMNKQLKVAENENTQNQKLPFQKLIEQEYSTSFFPVFPLDALIISDTHSASSPEYIEYLIPQQYLKDIFHPPQFV